jgi:hypothetical protein
MLTSSLGWNFFGLSSNYSISLANEYVLLSKNLSTSYSDFMSMPTYFRKYLVDKVIEMNTPKT